MNHLKENPVGIDKAVEQLQIPLYKALSGLNQKVKGFGRVHKNKKDKGFLLEVYDKQLRSYVDVLGGSDSRFYFYVHNEIPGDMDVVAKVDVICMANLNDYYSDEERRDQEFQILVADVIDKSRFKLKNTIVGVEYIQRIISDAYDSSNFSYSNMHPYHAVTFQTEVRYKLKTC